MEHERTEEREAMAAFTLWRLEHPDAGFVVGTIRDASDDGYCDVNVAYAGCSAMALVACAKTLLAASAEKFGASPFGDDLHHVAAIEQALDALPCENGGLVQ